MDEILNSEGASSANDVSTKEPSNGNNDIRLKRRIGVFTGVCLVINVMVGSGIFVVPTGVLRYCNGNAVISIVVWIAAGAIAMLGSLCVAELGSTIRQSGSWMAYLHMSFGNLPAFIYAWMSVLMSLPEAQAAQIVALGDYITRLMLDEDCDFDNLKILQRLIGICIFLAIVVMNSVSIKTAVRFQAFCAVAKTFALAVIGVAGIYQLFQDRTVAKQNFLQEYKNQTINHEGSEGIGVKGISLALYQGLWAFNGFEGVTFVTEEVKNPSRSVPIILYCAVPIVAILYVAVNVAYFAVLTPEEMISSNAVAVMFGERFHPVLTYFLLLSVCLSLAGTMSTALMISGRIPFVSGRLGYMPEFLSMAHVRYYSPVPAILVTAALSLILLSSGSFEVLVTGYLFIEWTFKGLSFAALLYLRKTRPDLERPYKVYTVTAVVTVIISAYLVLIPLIFQPEILYLMSVALVVFFAFVYFLISRRIIETTGIGTIGLIVQKLFLVVPTSKEAAGV